MSQPRVLVIANMPSYHNVELFNSIAKRGEISLRVIYLRRLTVGRQWKELRRIQHAAAFVPELRIYRAFYLNTGVTREILGFRPRLILITQYASVAMQAAMHAATLVGCPWVFWAERPGVEFAEQPTLPHGRLRALARRAALLPLRTGPVEVWGIGQRACDSYAMVTQRPVHNVPYYSDLGPFMRLTRTPSPDRRVRFVFAGKLVERKGFDLLPHAVGRLVAGGMDFQLRIAGDGPLRGLALALAERYPAVVQYEGFKELADIPSVMGAADVLVCPSRYDGWGMVIPEAMAAGLAVVSTDETGAALEMNVEGVTGYTVRAGSADALFSKMMTLADQPARAASLGVAARQRVSKYDASCGAERFSTAFMRILASTGSSA